MNFNELLELVRRSGGNSIQLEAHSDELKSARNASGDTLLHIVSAEGNADAVEALLRVGCDVNLRNSFGSPPIECAAWRDERSVVLKLIQAGAEIQMVDSTGFSTAENLNMMGKGEMVEWMHSRIRERDQGKRQ